VSAAEPLQIRSYRTVFALERRIYRVDRLRLNPGGIPVRGVVYCLVLLAAAALAGSAPLLGVAVDALPWYVRGIALPVASAAALTVVRVDGRPFHLAARAALRHACGPTHLCGARPCARAGRCLRPAEIVVLPDGSDSRVRRLRYSGPGAVLVTVAHERAERRGGLARALDPRRRPLLTVRELPGARRPARGEAIALRAGATLQTTARAGATLQRTARAGATPRTDGW